MRNKRGVLTVFLLCIVILIGVIAFFVLSRSQKTNDNPTTHETMADHAITENKNPEPLLTAKDETLGSGFTISYPKEWSRAHRGATNPTSLNENQKDETIITSPSGAYEVVLRVQTNIITTSACTPDYLRLKYLRADETSLPSYPEGRFVEYVVFFPSYNLYQFHVGLQKNTVPIREVTTENNTACRFMFSEFIQQASNTPNVPLTSTYLAIRPKSLLDGDNVKPGITEIQIKEKLSGVEYEQAKTIITSLRAE
jgi:hypothetical protein